MRAVCALLLRHRPSRAAQLRPRGSEEGEQVEPNANLLEPNGYRYGVQECRSSGLGRGHPTPTGAPICRVVRCIRALVPQIPR